jgi:hypothetical protein
MTTEISDELNELIKIRDHLELKINVLKDQENFFSSIDKSLSPFMHVFSGEYRQYFSKRSIDEDLNFLTNTLDNVVQQIKSVCKHEYQEDDIDITSGCCENTQKITYCSICYSTF